ncbi:zinc-dependent alcohol dehydrogenase [Pantoea coffeiphila]|uniref:zinc-dependent alcohol dehydrogenase n=1 Tax=Pantoea coffeiphila TaxID=1465635 RepID=UPI00195F6132|nr:alcohol dehydrogenase catalytic domain-containing protein [Pantoea coffeiphila]MBM7343061.1 (R,R)-butanediol dehydrogenase/meso-butanediol dehydrogenase/diacetyl reductase [Pantoea coffeiphila]
MKAVQLYGVGDLRVEEKSPAVLAAGQVRIQVRAAGICGSDIHNYRTGKWMAALPVTPGHELFGVVTEAADDTAGFAPGTRVVADSRVWCGTCPACLRGAHNLCTSLGFVGEVCDGGFAEQVVLPVSGLLRVPDEVADDIAVLSEPLGVALRVVNQLNPSPGSRVRVAGGGTIGGLVALLLHHTRQCRVQLSEPNAARRGRIAALIPLAEDGDYDFAVEATGIGSVLQQLVAGITSGGRVALVGIFHHDGELDFNQLVEREISLTGCSVFQSEQQAALELMADLADGLRTLIGPPVSLDDVPQAYEMLIKGKSSYLKTVVIP